MGGEARERIVVIDDDHAMRVSCRQILDRSGFDVETYEDGARGLAGLAAVKPALVVVDLKMPGLSGLEVIRRIVEIDPEIVIVVITGYATIDTAVEAMKSGAYDFLPKPFAPDELRVIVGRGLERRHLRQRSRRLEVEQELLKRRFVSFVSHQLKSPLAAIHQYLDVLQRLEDTPEIAETRRAWIDRCLHRTESLRRLIDDWLILARAEGRALVTRREPVELKPILVEVTEDHQARAAERGVSLGLELPDVSCSVMGDRTCLTVLFDNLVTNAIQYNRDGGRVAVTSHGAAGEVVVSVADTGIGIPEEARGFLFREFFRVPRDGNGAEARGPGSGTGLGLAICKRIVSELGGVIEVESEVGVGSTFRVRLPQHGSTECNENRSTS
jgi:two-component system, sensor histidine kinase and response regulator